MKAKSIPLILLILLALLAFVACAQQEQGTPKGLTPKKPAAKKPPVKLQYLTGEVLAVNKARKTILVRGKESDLLFHTDGRSTIRVDGQPGKLADVTAGAKVAVRYVEAGDRNIVRSLIVSTSPPEQKTPPEAPARTDVPAGKAAVQP